MHGIMLRDLFFSIMRPSSPQQLVAFLLLPILTFFLGIGIGSSTDKKVENKVVQTNATTSGSSLQTKETVSLNAEQVTSQMKIFWEVWNRLRTEHPDGKSVSDKDMLYGATKGIANAIGDPYTYFLTPEESKEFNTSLNGELEGIGAELTEGDGGVLTVVSTLKGTPAEKAGILPGDIIYKIDDESVANLTLYTAVEKIRGKKGTSVKITVVRKNEAQPLDFTIQREEIRVPSVSYEAKNEIAYIKIAKFSETTVSELNTIVNKLLLTPPRGIVLDLRDDGGGYLDASADVASMFLEKGKIVSTRGTKTDSFQEKSAKGEARLGKFPMVVLQNEQTASAAEIVAAALKDNGRAHIIGTNSYGKGSVQELEPLSDGSYLRITIAKWFTPNGYNVGDKSDGKKVGLVPDEQVTLSSQDRKDKKDPQLERALIYLREQLKK